MQISMGGERMTRRQVLQTSGAIAAAAGLAGLGIGLPQAAAAGQPLSEDQATTGSVWDPTVPRSPWGPGDEAGNSNTQTADKVLQAVKLIKHGTKYPLGRELAGCQARRVCRRR